MLCSFWTIFCWHLEFEGTKNWEKNGTPDMFFEEKAEDIATEASEIGQLAETGNVGSIVGFLWTYCAWQASCA